MTKASKNSGSRNSTSLPGYTHRQGQFLAFIHYYTKLNRQPPTETDMARYFEVSPPSVHQMLLTLEARISQMQLG